MRRALHWLGILLSGAGAAVIAASAVMGYMGLAASYNFGDPAKFQFYLVPFWQIGLGIAVVGVICLLLSRRRKGLENSPAR
jgi:hypothetical protein